MTLKVSKLSKPAVISSAALLGVYFGARMFSLWLFRSTRELGVSPGEDPPLYFIRQDLIHGASLAVGLLLYFGFVLLFFRRYLEEILRSMVGIIVFFIYPIVQAVLIYLSSKDLFDSKNASVPWQTFDEYLRIQYYTFFLTIGLYVGLILLWRFVISRERTKQ